MFCWMPVTEMSRALTQGPVEGMIPGTNGWLKRMLFPLPPAPSFQKSGLAGSVGFPVELK